ncbi:efflux RND transporter periplasmic adaptor subunit [Chitinimonas koreensis]|uniref:efflux RND transporter periplasmic adaptor subunit n=1 Tax=Chitinimonas koreensis TaxID=356302 RepID=UPI0004185ADA|nr:efflux RND transporter periplasmic adaptor subunit [Chitinimonas koreensis]QNM96032.1 efflux RND transporter periplasmic adaptor subunit [Chitinimonas koreensis]
MKPTSRLRRYAIPFVLLLAAAAALGWYLRRDPAADAERYRTERVERGALVQTVNATGTLNPVRVVSIGTQVSGTVKKLYVDFNSPVKAGQLLLELDTAQLDARLAQSRATLASNQARLTLARASAERMRALSAQNYVSRQELDQAEADFGAARASVAQSAAQVEQDRVNVQNAIIRSPVDGVVIDRQVDEGQTVAASLQTPTLVKIARDLSQMQINASVAEADLGRIGEGMPARFNVDAFPDSAFTGRVRQIRLNPTTTSNVVTYDVVVDVANPGQRLLPGMTAYVDIEVGRVADTLLVPSAALRYRPSDAPEAKGWKSGQNGQRGGRDGQAGGEAAGRPRNAGQAQAGAPVGERPQGRPGRVWVLREGKPAMVPVRTGLSDGRNTAVSSDQLEPGDQVIVGEKIDAKAAPAAAGRGSNRMGPGGPGMRGF